MSKKIVIVGGVAGGASAAARLRRLDEHAEIVLFERDSYISFANCGLPYYIGDTIQSREKLFVQTPEAMHARFNLDIRTNSEVIRVSPDTHTVTVRSQERGVYEETYDVLLLSPGAKPIRPPIPGIDSPNIYTLRNIPDTDRIKNRVSEAGIRSALVIGGGFIGLEMAENLRELGLEVTLVEAGPHVLAPFDGDMAAIVEKELVDHGVHLILKDAVLAFRDTANGLEAELNGGRVLQADMAVLAIGVAPDTGFLANSGIALGAKGHLLVNERLQTSLPDVYAVGDAAEVIDYVNGQPTAVPLAGPANKQGRIAADQICGLPSVYKGTQGTSILKVFGLTAASTGSNERTLQRLGKPYRVIYVHPNSHASYYPGATPISIKLVFSNDGRILGAQAVGYDGVDKRIDDIAVVLRMNGTVSDLAELELAYAPPFSSAKDPVNMAGYAAENVLTGRTDVIVPADLDRYDPSAIMLVDVRTPLEYGNGRIADAVNIPVDDIRASLERFERDKEIWVYCQVGLRGYLASRILKQHGFRVKNLTGGYKTYSQSRFVPPPPADACDSVPVAAALETPVLPEAADPLRFDRALDACGLCCPGPLMQVASCMAELKPGQVLKVTASDPGFATDIPAWCRSVGHRLLDVVQDKGLVTAWIEKSAESSSSEAAISPAATRNGTTMVVFDGDLDKAIAAFIIANGSAAMGKPVTLFFTFWGLNVLRKPEPLRVAKGFLERMFGAMMPRGTRSLPLSRMQMAGLGPKMIRYVMRSKNVDSLEELMASAIRQGVKLVACQMSMDVMGIKREELIDGIEIGGVGYYLGEAERSGVNLFI